MYSLVILFVFLFFLIKRKKSTPFALLLLFSSSPCMGQESGFISTRIIPFMTPLGTALTDYRWVVFSVREGLANDPASAWDPVGEHEGSSATVGCRARHGRHAHWTFCHVEAARF